MAFLDYLLENPIEAAILGRTATLVRVPDPARFALHKLIVAGERPAVEQAKAAKDRAQAAELLTVLYDARPGDVQLALEALQERPANWRKKIKASARIAPPLPPDLARSLSEA